MTTINLNVEWARLMHQFKMNENIDIRNKLFDCYNESHRHYHNINHLADVLSIANDLHANPEIKMALWFHDAIYLPMQQDNEIHSARWAYDFCRDKTVYYLIMSTDHRTEKYIGLHQLMTDIDKAIFSSAKEKYQEYERNIRLEFRDVPYSKYADKRTSILNHFLSGNVYSSLHFSDKELVAKKNIQWSIDQLKSLGNI